MTTVAEIFEILDHGPAPDDAVPRVGGILMPQTRAQVAESGGADLMCE